METPRSERLFPCNHCNRTFRRLEHLQRHTRILCKRKKEWEELRHETADTKEKPFTCQCGASFTRTDLLKRHSRIAHPSSLTHTSTLTDLDIEIFRPGSRESPPPLPASDTYPDGTSINFSSPDGHDATKRRLRLPVPPEDRHAEEAFRTTNGGKALQELLQDLLERANSPLQPPCVDQSVFPASGNESTTQNHQNRSEAESRRRHTALDVSMDDLWTDPRLPGTAGYRKHLEESLIRRGWDHKPLPSTKSLGRYIRAFLDGFHQRCPMFHTQTMRLSDLSPDLTFALLALGAETCLDNKAALYFFDSVVVMSNARHEKRHNFSGQIDAPQVLLCAGTAKATVEQGMWLDESSHRLCLMLLLTVFALQSRNQASMQVMWSFQGVFAQELRESLSNSAGQGDDSSWWQEWARRESRRRVQHAAFCVLNLVSMTFDFPAPVLFSHLSISLSCSAEEWHASSAEEWLQTRNRTYSEPSLASSVVESVLAGETNALLRSPVHGDHTIFHGILQGIQLLRQILPEMPKDAQTKIQSVSLLAISSAPLVLIPVPGTRSLPLTRYLAPRSGLSSFTRNHFTTHSAKDPGMYALAGLACAQLHLNIGKLTLASQDSTQLAAELHELPWPSQSARMSPALRFAVGILDTQLSTGLGTSDSSWGIGTDYQDFLCTVKLLIFLVKWLLLMADTINEQSMTENDERTIQAVGELVQEGARCVDLGELHDTTGPLNAAIGVLRMASYVCRRSSRELVHIVGKAFEMYASMLRSPG